MKVVVDANICVSLAVPLPYSAAAERALRAAREEGASLLAPALWVYEVVSALMKVSAAGWVKPDRAAELVANLLNLSIQLVPPDEALAVSSMKWAARLKQAVAYDGAYLALAERETAQFWTADSRVVSRARTLRLRWVHGIGM